MHTEILDVYYCNTSYVMIVSTASAFSTCCICVQYWLFVQAVCTDSSPRKFPFYLSYYNFRIVGVRKFIFCCHSNTKHCSHDGVCINPMGSKLFCCQRLLGMIKWSPIDVNLRWQGILNFVTSPSQSLLWWYGFHTSLRSPHIAEAMFTKWWGVTFVDTSCTHNPQSVYANTYWYVWLIMYHFVTSVIKLLMCNITMGYLPSLKEYCRWLGMAYIARYVTCL